MNTYINRLLKTFSFFLISLFFIFSGILVYAISFPGAPIGEINGGKFMNFFNLILVDTGSTTTGEVKLATSASRLTKDVLCNTGDVLQGIKPDGSKLCVTIPTSANVNYFPGCDTPDITLSNGQVWAACNVGSSVAGEGVASVGAVHDFYRALSDCPSGYRLPSRLDWEIAINTLRDRNFYSHLPTKIMLPAFQRYGYGNFITNVPLIGIYWTSTEAASINMAYGIYFDLNGNTMNSDNGEKLSLFSVRCIKN